MSDDVTFGSEGGAFDGYLCFAVYSTGLAFNRVYKPLLDQLELTYPQYLVILALGHREGQSVKELGEQLFLESNTLTPLLKRLEARGLLTRTRDLADERIVRVSLTDKGRHVFEDAACLSDKIFEATGLTRDQLYEMQKALVSLREHLRDSAGE